jgi:hypothetical protein
LIFISKENNKAEVFTTLNGVKTSHYNMENSKVVSGWILSNGKKLDIVKFYKDIEQQNSITTRVTPCMKKCILNAGVPEAVHVAIAIACGAACKVWATYLICQTFYAGVYGGEVTACAKKCPKPKSTIGLSCTVNG